MGGHQKVCKANPRWDAEVGDRMFANDTMVFPATSKKREKKQWKGVSCQREKRNGGKKIKIAQISERAEEKSKGIL